jgi:hypothetical protein
MHIAVGVHLRLGLGYTGEPALPVAHVDHFFGHDTPMRLVVCKIGFTKIHFT